MSLYLGTTQIKGVATGDAAVTIVEEGIDTTDATAVASDIASGKTAYVNGEKVTGNLYNVGSGSSILTDGDIDSVVDDYLRVETDRMPSDRIFRTGSRVRVDVPMSDFGNATASEVANGKTFTSAAGLKVTGTGEMASELADELATQDDLIAQIAAALEGKTAGGGAVKTTKTINIDWSGDEEQTCDIQYVSNGEVVRIGLDGNRPDVIEAEGGVVCMNNGIGESYYTNNFITFYNYSPIILIATQDGETLYPVSSSTQ